MSRDISYLPVLFHTLHKKMMEEHENIITSYDLTRKHVPFLMVMARSEEGFTQQEISEKMSMDKAHTSRTLRELEEKGYVLKLGEGSYKHKYIITEKAKKIKEIIKSSNDEIVKRMLEVLTDDEINQFESIIKKITDHVTQA